MLDNCTFLTLLNYLINPVAAIFWHIKSCERVENTGVGFTAQKVIDDVLDYDKVPVTIDSCINSQSDAKSMGTSSIPKNTRCATANSSTLEEVAGLKTNYDGNFTLDEIFHPLKAFVPEESYLGNIHKVFRGERR